MTIVWQAQAKLVAEKSIFWFSVFVPSPCFVAFSCFPL
jgi:hypothetical protein